MTKKIYFSEPNLYEYQANVKDVKENYIILDETIFYPEGGGQPADKGFIEDIPIIDVQAKEDEILHYFNKKNQQVAKSLIGKTVNISINKELRDYHTSQHTAQHLLSAILEKDYNSGTRAFHLGKEYATIDVIKAKFNKNKINELESKALDLIKKNVPITTKTYNTIDEFDLKKLRRPTPLKKNVRIVNINNMDFSACCGTHLKSSGKIVFIKILKVEKVKKYLRIYFIAGKKALKLFQKYHQLLADISIKFNTNYDQIIPKMENDLNEIKELRRKNKQLTKIITKQKAKQIISVNDRLIFQELNEANFNSDLLNQLVKELVNYEFSIIVVKLGNLIKVLSKNENFKVNVLINEFRKEFFGKGGGDQTIGQVKFESEKQVDVFLIWLKRKLS